MKLAEALQERADLNRKLEQLRERLRDSALAQEGEKPVEDPGELLEETNACLDRLTRLMTAINLTNSRVSRDGQTLTEMIARKDTLTLKLAMYREMLGSARRVTDRARGAEIRIRPTFDVRKTQKQVDGLAAELRTLDNRLQEMNWQTELME